MTFDPLRILAALGAHDVRYVLVGGLAATLQGSPSETDDVDICLASDDENLERLGLSLDGLGATGLPPEDDHRASFSTAAGRLDCLELPHGSLSFEQLAEHASSMDVGHGLHARVASLEDLVTLKRASGDLQAAAHLASLSHEEPAHVAEASAEDAAATEPPPRNRLWKALEDVDSFLTRLTEGERTR
jgi:hypothetical protein